MRVCLLASGSKGNAVYVETRQSRLLIDSGVSLRELKARLGLIGVEVASLDAVFLTHEHDDHCRGLGPLARAHRLPIWSDPDTWRAAMARIGAVPQFHEFRAGETVQFRDLQIETFPVTHDAAACVGFTLESTEGRIGVATDLGIATRLVAQRLTGCRALVLEFNHDEELLRDGPYPWHLKQRIRSNHGHLSNPAAAQLLDGLLWDGLEAVLLAHLSETNNTPGHALTAARQVLDRQNRCGPELILGCQHCPSGVFSTTL